MASSTSRTITSGLVLGLVLAAAVWLVSTGVNFTGKQKRVTELADVIQAQQNRMKELYDRRATMISTWLDTQAAKKPIADAKGEATDAAAAAEAQSAGTEVPAPTTHPVQDQEELNAVRAALEESRTIAMQSQEDFDRFDRLQNQISNYVAQRLLEQLRQEAEAGHGSVTLDQIRQFEQLEMEVATTRRDYHTAAFEKNQLLDDLSRLPFGIQRAPTPVPVFSTERTLHEQAAGR
ncbi:MAG: hypothetical protein NDI61_08915 [Bdellovibrionaceae bacterium]|nr:hypothetical protein [Pseudobdellovibrionaceae bacterium]